MRIDRSGHGDSMLYLWLTAHKKTTGGSAPVVHQAGNAYHNDRKSGKKHACSYLRVITKE
ncbi:hypothetical protein KDA_61890 [Dictyobacter alpinus]|uniref:Uncharacterized protein n=1 Tax=Dictyobacter alpinus TaxID=2014873 RepID=A0A402BH52_9CHLR|nr:hypothetical protein KDA_61890 [Dictyobacter alpinus]